MRNLIYVTSNGTKEKDYNKVKGTNYEVVLETVKEVEAPEDKAKRLERIAKAQAKIAKAYAEFKKANAEYEVLVNME